MKLALGCTVHEQLLAAVTDSVPVTPPAVTADGTWPIVTAQPEDDVVDDGCAVLLLHALAMSATIATMTGAADASTMRGGFIISSIV
jgi:hypothetical protein